MLTAAGYVRDGETWWIPSGTVFYSPGDGDDPAGELAFARRHFFLPRRFRDPVRERHDGLLRRIRPAGQRRTAIRSATWSPPARAAPMTSSPRLALDYRVLAPRLVSDPNRNQVAAAFDALGRVAGTAVMGKPEERLGDILDGFDPDPDRRRGGGLLRRPVRPARMTCSGRPPRGSLYDLDAYRRSRDVPQPQPAWVGGPGPRDARQRARARGADEDPAVVQLLRRLRPGGAAQAPGGARAGDDGRADRRAPLGRQRLDGLQQQGPARPPLRAVLHRPRPASSSRAPSGSAPSSSTTRPGGSIATLHPDHSYAKTVFDPWSKATWDANDTVLLDPRRIPTCAATCDRYLTALSREPGGWATWYEPAHRRCSSASAQQQAAGRRRCTPAPPTLPGSTRLGRTFLTVAHNRVRRDGRPGRRVLPQLAASWTSRATCVEARDALDRAVMRYGYTVARCQVAHAGMDIRRRRDAARRHGKPVLRVGLARLCVPHRV